MKIRQREYDRIERATASILEIERNGLAVDIEYAKSAYARAQADKALLLADLATIEPDVSFSSTQQVCELLYDRMGLQVSPVCSKGAPKRGKRPADRVALEWLARRNPDHAPLLGKIVKLRQISSSSDQIKRILDNVKADGLIHTVSGEGTAAGRLNLKKPNLSAVSKDKRKDVYAVRKCLTGLPGEVLIVADQTQLEVVLLAHFVIALFGESGRYLASFLSADAPDFHSTNARAVFGDFLGQRHPDGRAIKDIPLSEFKTDPFLIQKRDDIKAVWYGFSYGKGEYGFSTSLLDVLTGMPIGLERATELVTGLKATQQAIPDWQGYIDGFVRKNKYIWTMAGRILDLRKFFEGNDKWKIQKAFRKALNFPLQGSAADLMVEVMNALVADKELRDLGFRLCLLVHDEVVLRGPEKNVDRAMQIVQYHMVNSVKLNLELRCSCNSARTYYDAK